MRPLCLAIAIGSVIGCGGSGSSPIEPFLGVWTANGTQVENCPAGSHSDSATEAVTIVAGPSANEVTTKPAGGCSLNWTVSGTIATLAGSQTCGTFPGSVGGTWTPTFTGGTLTLSGTVIAVSDSGSAVYVNGGTQNCTFTQSGNYTKN